MADPKQVDLLRQGVEVWNKYAQTAGKIDLSWANLEGLDLPGADLRRADLRWANLRRADLWGANLWQVNLSQANLMVAVLDVADLRGAQLFGVDLSDASLVGVNCRTLVTFEGEGRFTILSRAIGLTQKQLDEMT